MTSSISAKKINKEIKNKEKKPHVVMFKTHILKKCKSLLQINLVDPTVSLKNTLKVAPVGN